MPLPSWAQALASNPGLLQMYLGMWQQGQAQNQNNQQFTQSQALSSEYQKQQDLARQANEGRYLDILDLLGTSRQRNLGDLAGYGQSQIADVNYGFNQQAERAKADLISRGLYGSTIDPAVQANIEKERQRALGSANDQIINRRVNTDIGLTNNIAGVMERRSDVPPDLAQLIGLQSGLGQGGPMQTGFGYTPQAQPGAAPMQTGFGYTAPNRPGATPFQAGFGYTSPYRGTPSPANVGPYGARYAGGNTQVAQSPFAGMPPGFMQILGAMGTPQQAPRLQTQGAAPVQTMATQWFGNQPYRPPAVGSSAYDAFGGQHTTLPQGATLAFPEIGGRQQAYPVPVPVDPRYFQQGQQGYPQQPYQQPFRSYSGPRAPVPRQKYGPTGWYGNGVPPSASLGGMSLQQAIAAMPLQL